MESLSVSPLTVFYSVTGKVVNTGYEYNNIKQKKKNEEKRQTKNDVKQHCPYTIYDATTVA